MDLSEYFDDKPNYDYWLLLDSWNIQQISCLFCGDDPNSTGYNLIGRVKEMRTIVSSGYRARAIIPVSHAIRAKQTEDDLFFLPKDVIKWAIKKSLDIPKELVDWYDQYKKQKNSKQVIEQLDIERENYRLIAVENESLKKQLEKNHNDQKPNNQQTTDDDLHPRERNTLLKIIAVMAKDGYNNGLSEPYALAKIIAEQGDLLEITIDFKTIGDKFKDAKQFLPDSD